MLAGVYLCVEAEEDFTVRPYQSGAPSAATAGHRGKLPTPDQLAGVYLCVEGSEDLRVYPRSAAPATEG
jgi:hypothetical protein